MQPTLTRLYRGDSRNMESFLSANTFDLILCGPPYWNEVKYSDDNGQLSRFDDYTAFLDQMRVIWQKSSRVAKNDAILAFWSHDLIRADDTGWHYVPLHNDLVRSVPSPWQHVITYIWDRYQDSPQNLKITPSASRLVSVSLFKKGNPLHCADFIQKKYWQPIWKKKTNPKLFGTQLLFRVAQNIKKYIPSILQKNLKKFFRGVLFDPYKFKHYTTECPPEIAFDLISNLTKPGDTILDPFAGSGTTLLVASSLHRNNVGIEINSGAITALQKKIPHCEIIESGEAPQA